MRRIFSGDSPVLDLLAEQWPVLIFLPSVLLLVAVLALVTRRWDRRDAAARAQKRRAAAVASRPKATVAPSRTSSRPAVRSTWWRRQRCTCSWCTVPTADDAAAGSGRRAA